MTDAGGTEAGMAGQRRSGGLRAERRGGTFDAFDLALRRAALAGTADVASMPRAVDRLAEGAPSAEVSWRITGAVDGSGRPALEIRLDGSVPLTCQRCLQQFAWVVAQRTTLLLARSERELAVLDDGDDVHEVLLAAAPQEISTLIEDEMVLALPFAPRCEQPECAGHPVHSLDPDAPRASAFASLAGMKNDHAGKAKN
jgi:DUF177 domain-containing protein